MAGRFKSCAFHVFFLLLCILFLKFLLTFLTNLDDSKILADFWAFIRSSYPFNFNSIYFHFISPPEPHKKSTACRKTTTNSSRHRGHKLLFHGKSLNRRKKEVDENCRKEMKKRHFDGNKMSKKIFCCVQNVPREREYGMGRKEIYFQHLKSFIFSTLAVLTRKTFIILHFWYCLMLTYSVISRCCLCFGAVCRNFYEDLSLSSKKKKEISVWGHNKWGDEEQWRREMAVDWYK